MAHQSITAKILNAIPKNVQVIIALSVLAVVIGIGFYYYRTKCKKSPSDSDDKFHPIDEAANNPTRFERSEEDEQLEIRSNRPSKNKNVKKNPYEDDLDFDSKPMPSQSSKSSKLPNYPPPAVPHWVENDEL